MARKEQGLLERPPGSGKFYVRITINGKNRLFRVSNRSEGKALYGRLKSEVLSGKHFEKPKATPFRTIAKEYGDRVSAKQRRKKDDRARLRFWISVFGDQDAQKITTRQIEHVLSELGKTRAPATVIRYLTTLKAALNNAKRLRIIQDNPATRVKVQKVDNVLVRYITPEQEVALLKLLPPKYAPVVTMALHTGCRQGELLRLLWSDIDWHLGILTIRETKAGDTRRIPLNSRVQEVLTGLKKKQASLPGNRIFPLDDRYLRRAFDRAVKASGLSPFRFHDLRHTFASRLAMQGANDRTLMALGGWKSPAMLSRYAHLLPTHLWQAVEGLVSHQGQLRNESVTKSVTEEERQEGKLSHPLENNGEPRAPRTLDPRLKRAMLYQLS